MLAMADHDEPCMDRLYDEMAERNERAEIAARALRVAGEREARDGPYWAEIVPNETLRWHLVEVAPRHEGVAAAHLAARRFGTYVPDLAVRITTPTGGVGSRRVRMWPGYVLVAVWDIERHRRRIEACPGVTRIVRHDYPGKAVEVSHELVYDMQVAEENSMLRNEILLRPEWRAAARSKRHKKRRWINKNDGSVIEPGAAHMITISPKSYWRDLDALDDQGRVGALHTALGLP